MILENCDCLLYGAESLAVREHHTCNRQRHPSFDLEQNMEMKTCLHLSIASLPSKFQSFRRKRALNFWTVIELASD